MLKKAKKIKLFFIASLIGLFLLLGSALLASFSIGTTLVQVKKAKDVHDSSGGGGGSYVGNFTPDLPEFPEIKGAGQISDKVAQYAVGTAVKYHLLPSVILSQYAYESSWGKATSALLDNNNFGITWYQGCPFTMGSPRGIGGSEGGYYMHFPTQETGFSYYGYMVATQDNFKAAVGQKDPGTVLLTLGRGGYASAGITETSPYYTNCMSIIKSNNWINKYDKFAIAHWSDSDFDFDGGGGTSGGAIPLLESVMGQQVGSGQCYALSSFYVNSISHFTLQGLNAYAIGADNLSAFESHGWKVIFNPKANQLVSGAVINWNPGPVAGSQYGHTGIIESVKNGKMTTYEQNVAGVQVVQKEPRTWDASISSICIPPK